MKKNEKKEASNQTNRYYSKDGEQNEELFHQRLEELESKVDGATLPELLKIRSALHRLKQQYERSGKRFLDCEYTLIAVNEVIADCRCDTKGGM